MLKVIKRSIPVVAILAVLILGAICDRASAVQQRTDFVVRVKRTLSLIVPRQDIYLALNPESDEIVYKDVDIEVRTNNKNGAAIYLTTNKNYGPSISTYEQSNVTPYFLPAAALIGRNTNGTIGVLQKDNVPAAEFPGGYWGVSTDGGATWGPVYGKNVDPQYMNPIAEVGGSGSTGTATVRIGAKATEELLSDYYENTILFTAVATYTPKTMNDIIYMQELDEEVIDSMGLNYQYQLVDARDDKKYWVAKLDDGNVWMTQNLDLTLSRDITLTPDDTDIRANWTPLRDTIEESVALSDEWTNDGSSPYSYGAIDKNSRAVAKGYISSTTTPSDVDSRYAFPYGTYVDRESCTSSNESTRPGYCEHYNVGKYYNWAAAVAMNNTTTLAENGETATIDQSICPAGWRLPTGYTSGGKKGEFATLLGYAGIASSNTSASGKTTSNYINSNNANTMMASPLFLANAGVKTAGVASIEHAYGSYWTATAHNFPNVDRIQFATVGDSSQIINSNYYPDVSNVYEDLGVGRSIRCVFRPTREHKITYVIDGMTVAVRTIANSTPTASVVFNPNEDINLSSDNIFGNKHITGWCSSIYNAGCSNGAIAAIYPGDTLTVEGNNIYIIAKTETGKILNFYANGGSFDGGSVKNSIMFTGVNELIQTTSSKSSSGVRKSSKNDQTYYGNYQNYNDYFNFGDRRIKLSMTYGTESCCDRVYINNSSYSGQGTVELEFEPRADIRVSFSSDGSVVGYGYWIEFYAPSDYGVAIMAGEIKTPTREGHNFLGWSTDPNVSTPDWVLDTESGVYGDNTDVYAVWD